MKYTRGNFTTGLFGQKAEFRRKKLRIFIIKHIFYALRKVFCPIIFQKQSVYKLIIYIHCYTIETEEADTGFTFCRKVVESMLGRKRIASVFTVVVAALLVTAFAYQASAYSVGDNASYTYTGKIIEVDKAHNYVTVQAGSNSVFIFKLVDYATVMMCNKIGSLNDLKPGDLVTVYYFQENLGGRHIASEIDSATYGMKSC